MPPALAGPVDPGVPPAGPAQPALGDPAAAPAGVPLLQVPRIARSKSRTTARLMEIFQPLVDQGVPFDKEILPRMAPFPVAGLAFFSHDWGFPRYNPYPHLHEGTDIFADCGTPIIASERGTLAGFGNTGIGGLSVWISSADGSGRYYTHLAGFAPGLVQGQPLEPGTLIGF
ncbi:MAG: M23 family metallopeptidase, partial [Actinomycetota bacterium]